VSFDPTRPASPVPLTPPEAETAPIAPTQFGSEPSTIPAVATTPVVASSPTAAPPAAAKAARNGRSGRWLNLVLVVAAAVAIGGVAFAVGRGTAPVSAATGNGRGAFAGRAQGASFAPGANGRGGFGGGGFTVRGTVESVNGTTLTIKTATGQTIEVTTGASTTYTTQTPATSSDVQPGKTVEVQLDFGGTGRPSASATTSGPLGTAGSVTVIP